MNNYHVHISGEKRWFELNLKEVWRYRDLVVLFTKRSFTLTYKQTVLGPVWLFLRPLLTSVIYTFVFGNIAGMSTDGVPHILFYMCSNAIWAFFAQCVNSNAATFTNNAHVFGKVYFPRLTIPVSNVLSAIIRFGIQMSMVFVILIYYVITKQVSPNWLIWLTVPAIIILLGIMGMGIGIIISSLTTKYRDLSILVGFGVSLWMYASPVIYPISTMGNGWLRIIMLCNPVAAPIELFRYAIVGTGEIIYVSLCWSLVFTLFVTLFGIMIFNRVEKTFMDTV